MRAAEKILAEVEKECPDLNNRGVPYPLEIEEHGLKIRADLIDLDRLGCIFHQITLKDTEAGLNVPSSRCSFEANQRLEFLSRQIEERITYLLEDLAVIEWDKNSSTLLMRSQPPESNSRYICYYELLLSQGTYLALTRCRYDREAACKHQEPIRLTREVFVRLIDDLATIIKTQEQDQ